MNKLRGIIFAVSLAANAIAADTKPKTPDVAMEVYGGWSECLVLRGGDCKAVVVPAIGGRVLNYSINGENILFDNPAANGRTLLNSSNFQAGGYQLDVGPELRGIPNHRWLWQGPWNWRVPRPFAVHTYSEPEHALGVQLEKDFVIDPDSGELGLTQRLRNIASNDVSFCLWDRTLCKGGGFALVPLNKKSRFKAGWAMRQGKKVSDYRYEGDLPSDARVRIMDGVLVAHAKALPDAPELKVGADSDAGWIAYARGKVLFVKYFPVFADADYSDGGNSVEFYCNDRVAELEPISPETKLTPDEVFNFPEKWILIELPHEITTYEKARALVKQIPRSPFAR
ncbi:MAG TPA: hypothetical protein VK846_04290 [Candidatus Limnocylindria bacterium]|nr:hypothetical protein [Candidatus Limnocylindria bacterium]